MLHDENQREVILGVEKTEELDKDNEKLRKWVQGEEKRYFVTSGKSEGISAGSKKYRDNKIEENKDRKCKIGGINTEIVKLVGINTESVKLVGINTESVE